MARFTEQARRVTTRRVQAAGIPEQGGISQFLGAGQQGLAQAPGIAQILALLQQGTQQPFGNLDLLRRQVFQGITQGAQPQIDLALRRASELASARGVPRSSIDAALSASATTGVISPLLGQAQSQFAGLIPFAANQPLQQAGALQGLRSQAFNELGAALQRNLSERSMNSTTTESLLQRRSSLFKRLLGAAVGSALGPVGGAIGGALGRGFSGLFGTAGQPTSQVAEIPGLPRPLPGGPFQLPSQNFPM